MTDPFSFHPMQRQTRRSFRAKAQPNRIGRPAGLLEQDQPPGPAPPGFPFPTSLKAKRVVFLWQGGGPSHIDLLDPKPMLTEMAGKDIPGSVRGDTRLSTMSSNYKAWPCVPEIKPFETYGQCGTEMSSMLPNLGKLADELCIVRSLNTEAVNHAPGVTFMMTGSQIPGRPSMGAWLTYGLGTKWICSPSCDLDRQRKTQAPFMITTWERFLTQQVPGFKFARPQFLFGKPSRGIEGRGACPSQPSPHELSPPRWVRGPRDRDPYFAIRNGLPNQRPRSGGLQPNLNTPSSAINRTPANAEPSPTIADRPPLERGTRFVQPCIRMGSARQPLHPTRTMRRHRRPSAALIQY